MRVETIFGGLPCRHSLTPCVFPSRARSLFRPLLPSAFYAGYLTAGHAQHAIMCELAITSIDKSKDFTWKAVIPLFGSKHGHKTRKYVLSGLKHDMFDHQTFKCLAVGCETCQVHMKLDCLVMQTQTKIPSQHAHKLKIDFR